MLGILYRLLVGRGELFKNWRHQLARAAPLGMEIFTGIQKEKDQNKRSDF